MKEKVRLDIAVAEQNPDLTREKARSLIMEGKVFVDNQKAEKAGMFVTEENKIEVRGEKLKYVSRGGLKLEKAAERFDLNLSGKVCMDIGASTGGFTDCMLQNGAQKVYSVDVGYGQLAWKLRSDSRVVNMERTNIRHVTAADIPEPIDFISIDVSFISLKLVLPVAAQLLSSDGMIVALVKPQFEAGREKVGKKGVVRDPAVHIEVIESVTAYCETSGLCPAALDFSPIRGPEGNIEYLLKIVRTGGECNSITAEDIRRIVELSHSNLGGNAD